MSSFLDRFIPWQFRSRHNFVKAHANFFLRDVLRTKPVECDPNAGTEVHVLVCRQDVNMCLLAIKSLLKYVNNLSVIVHDDGSLGEDGRKRIADHIRGVKLISRAKADLELREVLPDDMWQARQKHIFLMKLFDFNYFNNAGKTVLLDSDIVFVAEPDEIVKWCRSDGDRSFYNSDPKVDTFRAKHYESRTPLPRNFNAGFMGYIGRIELSEILSSIQEINYFLEDQTVYAYLMKSRNAHPLDPRRYHIYEGGHLPPDAKMVHFIGPNRFTSMTYVQAAKEVCSMLRA